MAGQNIFKAGTEQALSQNRRCILCLGDHVAKYRSMMLQYLCFLKRFTFTPVFVTKQDVLLKSEICLAHSKRISICQFKMLSDLFRNLVRTELGEFRFLIQHYGIWPIAFVITASCLLIWRFWTFTLLPSLNVDHPKQLPYWIPGVFPSSPQLQTFHSGHMDN